MSTSSATAWRELLLERRQASGWRALRVAAGGPVDIQLAVAEPEGRPSLLIAASASAFPRGVKYPDCVGFTTYPESLAPGPNGRVRVVLQLKDEAYGKLFEALCDDVIAVLETAQDDAAAVHLLLGRLSTWQRFASRFGTGVLSSEGRLGLFGELHFLSTHCLSIATASTAVDMWRGPLREPHDFHHGTLAVEVKTSGTLGANRVHIANLEQLHCLPGQVLLLNHKAVAESDRGESLPQLVDAVRLRLRESDLGAVDLFNARLTDFGYLDAHADESSGTQYLTVGERWFAVNHGFPRLTPADVPHGLSHVSYTIDLEACREFELSPLVGRGVLVEQW